MLSWNLQEQHDLWCTDTGMKDNKTIVNMGISFVKILSLTTEEAQLNAMI